MTSINVCQGPTSLEVQSQIIAKATTGIDLNDMQENALHSPKCSSIYSSESPPDTPVKSRRLRPSFLDDTSTDSGDLSTTNTDESDEGEESVTPTSRNSSRMYPRDALLLLRTAVGICAQPQISWGTEYKSSGANESSDGPATAQQRPQSLVAS